MGNKKRKEYYMRKRIRAIQHKISVIAISCVIVMLAAVLAVGSVSLHKKNENYKVQEAKLEAQLQDEQARAEEIAELEEYVGTDTYVEDVAKEKLGLIYPNEILFKAE